MGDLSLFIVALGAILVNVCSSTAQFTNRNMDGAVGRGRGRGRGRGIVGAGNQPGEIVGAGNPPVGIAGGGHCYVCGRVEHLNQLAFLVGEAKQQWASGPVVSGLNFDGSNSDEPVRMASDSLVVKSYKEVDTSTMASSTPDDPDFQIYQGVMGRPGIDFPVYPNIPATDFNCREIKRSGYYADLATDCQVFHICDGGRKISFLCPNGTIFRQSHLICDWWFRVDCGKSVELYEESAEQLAADQKIYKARAEERERRRKLVKSAFGESDDELVGSEVYALDEPFDIRNRKYPQAVNKAPSTTPIPPSTTVTSIRHPDEGKRERNSKKVVDSKFPRQGKSDRNFEDVPEKKIIEKISYVHPRARNQDQQTTPRTIHPVIVQKSRFPGRNSIPPTIKENIQEAASGGLVGNFRFDEPKPTETPESIGLTTEYPDFEIKKTTTEIKYETTTYDSRRTPTPRYRPQDQERQHFAETASFTSNRGGKTYNDFQNEYNRALTSTKKVTSPPTPTSPVYKPTVPVIKTTPRPSKQNSRKVTLSPSASTYTPSINITRSTTQRIPIENIYFTTIIPEKVENKPNGSDVDISLQELNIHKSLADTQTNNKSYEDAVREGLEVPPSSGPNALRSFALYFASTDNSDKKEKIGPYLSKDILIIPITKDIEDKITKNNFESKKKDVVKQVEDIVQDKSISVPSQNRKAEALPNSLTQQTKESYSALFGNNSNVMSDRLDVTETDYGTTGFESFTEQPVKINSELTNKKINNKNNDLDQSQSRGIVEPDPRANQLHDEFSRVSPDLRELAQVFTKALSAYLDDPEAFRRVLSEIRPTEPSPRTEEISSNPIDYPSATQEDDEVLDFSDVTKASYKKKSSTNAYRETTTEYIQTEPPTTNNEFENLVLPLTANENQNNVRIPDIELQAPLFESLDQSQSRYYTPSPNVGTTNAIAEEINNEFSTSERLPEIDSNEAVDSYFPITGSVDDKSRPRYGGFQNNSRASSKYSPYGAELTSTYSPYGAELISTTPETTTIPEERITTFNPRSRTSLKYEEVIKNQTDEEIALAKELNNLAIPTKPEALPLHISNSINNNPNKYQSVKLGNGETIERTYPRGRTTEAPQQYETNPEEINLELSPPFNTEQPKGFLITYSLEDGFNKYLPKSPTTTEEPITTTIIPTTEKLTTLTESETLSPTTFNVYETSVNKFTRATRYPTTTEEIPPARPPKKFSKSTKSLQRITELQEELMFNTTHVSNQQRERARIMVEETMGKMNMTESTADTLMKMMEMAAKNETYRRLVLLLVNDKSGKNKTVEEARLSLLKALLTPVLTTTKSRKDPTTTTTTTTTIQPSSQEPRRRTSYRRSKSISNNSTRNAIRTTTVPPSTTVVQRRITTVKSSRRTKTTRAVQRVVKTTETPTTTIKSSTVLGNLGLIRKTIENSKSKEVRINSLDDAILDSDSRAIELLRSLYSLAARWG